MTDLIDARFRSTLSDDETWLWPSTVSDTGSWLSGREFYFESRRSFWGRPVDSVREEPGNPSVDAAERLFWLDNNWDGYGAAAPSVKSLQIAVKFLRGLPESVPTPEVTASVTGGILIEWESMEVDIVLEIERQGSTTVYVRRGDVEEEGPLTSHQASTAEALATLSTGTH